MNGEKLPPVEALRKGRVTNLLQPAVGSCNLCILLYWMPTRGGPSKSAWYKWFDLSRPNLRVNGAVKLLNY